MNDKHFIQGYMFGIIVGLIFLLMLIRSIE